MLKPGMILDERYEIVDVVGSGGMSIVYKAKDHRLKRFVAIKVLKPEFSNDMNFVSKFRVEAQASAGLAHPNIVNVYDVCEDDGLYFIVMELVEGITLKDYIAQVGRLSMDMAIDFSIQIASGLEAAHEHHIIHRDIKPQNIIVSKNGNIKVTDFGIAKAATSNTMSTTGMGSVHYISPEQARGGYSDERSDIYSLGITMYEMVTGRVPFEGDNNVSVALMHIQNDIIPPRQYYPDIYSSLEKIILKATQKKPERRYLTANALIADLKRVQANPNIDIVVAPLGVTNSPTQKWSKEEMNAIKTGSAARDASSLNTFPVNNQGNMTGVSSVQPGTNSRLNQLLQEDDYDFDDEDEYSDNQSSQNGKRGGIKKVDDYEDEDDTDYDSSDDDGDGVDPKLEKVVMVAGVAAAVIIAVIVMVIIGNIMGWFRFGDRDDTTDDTSSVSEETTEIEMIDVVGVSRDAAASLLDDAGFTNYKFESQHNEDYEEGYVYDQSVKKGEMIAPDAEIIIYVSAGAEDIQIENVVGMENNEATKILEDQGFKVTHSFEASDTVEKDKIISMTPSGGSMAPSGSTVNIVVSNGPDIQEVSVPNLLNKSEADARSTLESFNLEIGNVTHENSDTYASGYVMRQSISAGTTVNEGTSVDIVISDGPRTVTYTASLSGVITNNGYPFVEGETITIQVSANIGGTSYPMFTSSASSEDAFPMDVSGASRLDGLTSGSGTLSVRVTAGDGTDISSYFSSNGLSLSFTQN